MNEPESFADVCPELRASLDRRGYQEPTAVQKAVLKHDSEGRNLRISSQTGSGKTVAVGLAIGPDLIARVAERQERPGPMALLITPTRELAVQVQTELRWLYEKVDGLACAVVTGGTDVRGEQRTLSRMPAVVVGTPGRILDHVRSKSLVLSSVSHVVLDEADRMLDMGFRDELEEIVKNLPEERRSHLVSATFPPEVRRFADRFQRDALHIEGTRLGAANVDIEHLAHIVGPRERYAALVNALLMMQGDRCLVFVQRRSDASEVAEKLAKDGFSAMPFSGDLAQAQRTRTLQAFRSGAVEILVATDVAARGIDVADISTVVHLELPEDPDTYTHRSGRTGRAGQKGRSLLLVVPQAERRIRRVLTAARVEATWEPLPGPKKVKKELRKRARRKLRTLLAEEQELGESQLEYAKELLEQYDPPALVAHLVQMAEPPSPCEPKDITHYEPRASGAPGAPGAPRPPRHSTDYVRFLVNWGHERGATPGRLLALACRRSGLTSDKMGAVRIDAFTASIEVAKDVAEVFESEVAKPDPRDPRIRIRRDEGIPPARGSAPYTPRHRPDSAKRGGKRFGGKPWRRGR